MLRNDIYYGLKPLIPKALRMGVRRRVAARTRRRVSDVWPIMPGSERPLVDWPGWPDGKRFAVVLTHDVEGQLGLAKCHQLMELEMELGFRSSFNFIPEGTCPVNPDLRMELVRNGFEICVHDLRHDGRLYRSQRGFRERAKRINRYLNEWDAVGFRSGFMLHNLDWLHALDIEYDMSTFDTDPFEPQPEGRHTIFPFWIKRPAIPNSTGPIRNVGYSELPYTLAQDSTLFLLLQERSIDIWKQKVDWIAQHGGIILLNTHPDYMAMGSNSADSWEYPATFYNELLLYIRSKYESEYWHTLPREVARFVRLTGQSSTTEEKQSTKRHARRTRKAKIWIDLDNTPHVPFFEPIVEELTARGFPLMVTARDAFQVCELADKKGLSYTKIGRHHGKNRALKGAGLIFRALQLSPMEHREKPALAVSHGSRSQILLSNLLGIPTILIEDYEHSQFPRIMRPTWIMTPGMIPDQSLCLKNGHIRKYSGIKEDVYVWKLVPDPSLLGELGLSDSDLVVTVRPPATEAHYHRPESVVLFERFMNRASQTPEVKIVLLPRNQKQSELLRHDWPAWFERGKTIIPPAAIDGLNLMWHSDLVVSGGGTMNREAAALGVPVFSIFRGAIGAVDRHLNAEGRLVLVESLADVEAKIPIVKRPRKALSEATSRRTLNQVVDTIQEIAESYSPVR